MKFQYDQILSKTTWDILKSLKTMIKLLFDILFAKNCQLNMLMTAFQNCWKRLILAISSSVCWLWCQFWAPKLHPIGFTKESAMVRHTLRKIWALGRRGSDQPGRRYGVKRMFLKTIKFLPAKGPAFKTLWIIWYTHLDLRLGLGILMIRTGRKKLRQIWAKTTAGLNSPKP